MKKVNKILDDIGDDRLLLPIVPLYKKWSFILRISSVSVTKSEFPVDLVTFTEEFLNGNIIFVCSVPEIADIMFWYIIKTADCCNLLDTGDVREFLRYIKYTDLRRSLYVFVW